MLKKRLKYDYLLFPDKRPECPRCGEGHVISRGIEWGCTQCGRRWPKKKNWGKQYEKKNRKTTKRKDKGNK